MYWIISQVKGLAFPVQYRAAKVGPPVRYQSKICGYWCVLAVLYCRSSPALLDWHLQIQSPQLQSFLLLRTDHLAPPTYRYLSGLETLSDWIILDFPPQETIMHELLVYIQFWQITSKMDRIILLKL